MFTTDWDTTSIAFLMQSYKMLADELHICNDGTRWGLKTSFTQGQACASGGWRGYVYTEIHRLGKLSVNHKCNWCMCSVLGIEYFTILYVYMRKLSLLLN